MGKPEQMGTSGPRGMMVVGVLTVLYCMMMQYGTLDYSLVRTRAGFIVSIPLMMMQYRPRSPFRPLPFARHFGNQLMI